MVLFLLVSSLAHATTLIGFPNVTVEVDGVGAARQTFDQDYQLLILNPARSGPGSFELSGSVNVFGGDFAYASVQLGGASFIYYPGISLLQSIHGSFVYNVPQPVHLNLTASNSDANFGRAVFGRAVASVPGVTVWLPSQPTFPFLSFTDPDAIALLAPAPEPGTAIAAIGLLCLAGLRNCNRLRAAQAE